MKIAIEIDACDRAYVFSQLSNTDGVKEVKSRQFQADTQTIQLLIDLAVVSLPIIGSIIVNLIKSKKTMFR